MNTDILDKELAFFNEKKSEWVKIYPNKFVLVKDHELIGTFDTADAAVVEGVKRYGLTSFLVRQVNQMDDTVFIPTLSLGLLYATP
jgi:hypothetical protein